MRLPNPVGRRFAGHDASGRRLGSRGDRGGLLGTVVDVENWSDDDSVLVVALCAAGASAAFNWWQLWSTRNRR